MKLDSHRQYVIGTAGHIDHGKTALVKALTGIDTDRLPEEKKRGITIDIGFAHLSSNITIIDVPGHERLIKNMVAGVSTIDLVLFVIAADDGIMPQTREHLDIVNLLQIQQGIFVITKCDLVEADWLDLVKEDVRALLQDTPFRNAPILQASAETGEGIEQTRAAILETLAAVPPRHDVEIFRLPVDRVFTMKGFGTVVTGTVLSGGLKIGDQVEIQPSGKICRVRGLQSHDKSVEQASAGYRAAVNLAGIDLDQIQRGEVLTAPAYYRPVNLFNARLTLLKSAPVPLKNNQRVRVHIHTLETFARVVLPERKLLKPGESAFIQMRLEEPIHAAFQDRFIIRRYSPQHTLGGGVILQTNPLRFRKKYLAEFKWALEKLEKSDAEEKILACFRIIHPQPLTEDELKVGTNLKRKELGKTLQKLPEKRLLFRKTVAGKTVYFSRRQIEETLNHLRNFLREFHRREPGKPGLSEAEIISGFEKRYSADLIRLAITFGRQEAILAQDGGFTRLKEFTQQLSRDQSALLRQIQSVYHSNNFAPPTYKEALESFGATPRRLKETLNSLPPNERPVYLTDNILYHPRALLAIRQKLAEYFRGQREVTVSQFRELLGITRKHAIPLLEYFDQHGITRRDGDVRLPGPELKT